MELGFVKIRYKLPKSDTSQLITTPITRNLEFASFDAAPRDARFATAVAGFAQLLRGGRHTGSLSYDDVLSIASAARGPDEYGYRSEFLQLVRNARGARSLAALGQ
jgi:Ca-activated chloride channel family protein